MHLVAEHNDLVLLLGYDLTEITTQDKYQRHKQLNYQNAFRATLNTYPNVQFVLIDHSGDLDKSFKNISNITCDKFESVLQLLN
jgi:basic membrane lipoprotein Med (substrate-binding protein (PBP1-ABC) superfamily)